MNAPICQDCWQPRHNDHDCSPLDYTPAAPEPTEPTTDPMTKRTNAAYE